MRILLIPKNISGITDLQQIENIVLEQVQETSQITQYLLSNGKMVNNYKYCAVDDDAMIPFYINVIDQLQNAQGLSNFSMISVKFKDINLPEDQKQNFIKKKIIPELENNIKMLEAEGMKALFYEKIGQGNDDNILKIGAQIEDNQLKIKNFDYTQYLDELI